MSINLGNMTLVLGNITLGEMTLRRLDQTSPMKYQVSFRMKTALNKNDFETNVDLEWTPLTSKMLKI